jgi:hypothetical protein
VALRNQRPPGPHICSLSSPPLFFPPTSLFQPSLPSTATSLSEQPKLKKAPTPFLKPPDQSTPKSTRLARHYYSRRSLTPPLNTNRFPRSPQKTRVYVRRNRDPESQEPRYVYPRPFFSSAPRVASAPLAVRRCKPICLVLGGTDISVLQQLKTTPPRSIHKMQSLTQPLVRPLRRSRRGLGTDHSNPGVHPYPYPAYVSRCPTVA